MATIYVTMEDEGVDVWRPVEAADEGGGIYRISETPMPDGEAWEFPLGSTGPLRAARAEPRPCAGRRCADLIALVTFPHAGPPHERVPSMADDAEERRSAR